METKSHTLNVSFPVFMGKDQDFDWVFRAYYAPLRYFCEQATRTDTLSEDIVTDLFTKLWERNSSFESIDHIQAFLYRSAKNACINYLNKEKLHAQKHELIAAKINAEPAPNYLDHMIRAEVWAEIYRAIENLPSQCRKVISLSYIEGRSNQEIADELELSMQTVKNYKQRGLNVLRENLNENMLMLLLAIQYLK